MGTAKITPKKRKLRNVTIKKYGFFVTIKITNNVGGDNINGAANRNDGGGGQ